MGIVLHASGRRALRTESKIKAQLQHSQEAIAYWTAQKGALEGELDDVLRHKELANKAAEERFNASILYLSDLFNTFKHYKLELIMDDRERTEKRFRREFSDFLQCVNILKKKEAAKNNPNYEMLANSVCCVESLARSVFKEQVNFDEVQTRYRALEKQTRVFDPERNRSRLLGVCMKGVGAALIGLCAVAAMTLVFLPLFLPCSAIVLMGCSVAAVGMLGAQTRFEGKDLAKNNVRQGLVKHMLLFGDSMKDMACNRAPYQLGMFEEMRRDWFR